MVNTLLKAKERTEGQVAEKIITYINWLEPAVNEGRAGAEFLGNSAGVSVSRPPTAPHAFSNNSGDTTTG